MARDVVEPSPLAHEILKAQPYAFLDDAPLEERRTQAVSLRRWLDPETASDLGALDASAIAAVREEAWPEAETPDELHDALLTLGFVTVEEGDRSGWERLFDALARPGGHGPAATARWTASLGRRRAAAPDPGPPSEGDPGAGDRRAAAPRPRVDRGRGARSRSCAAGWKACGPVTAEALAASLGLRRSAVETALASLEAEGFVFRGRFTPGARGRSGASGGCSPASIATRWTGCGAEIEPVLAGRLPALPPRLAAGRSRRPGRGAGEPATPCSASSRASRPPPPPGRGRSCRRG